MSRPRVRQLAILAQAAGKYGDTVANNSSFAFQKAGAAMEDFQLIIGSLINIAIVPLVNLFTELMTKVNGVLEAIFGKQIAQLNQSAAATENNAAAMGDLADQTEQAGKAAKGALAPFDEINLISSSSEPGGSNGGGGGIAPPINQDISPIEQDFSALIDRIQQKLNSLGFDKLFDKFRDFFDKIKQQIAGHDFGGALLGALEGAIGFAVSALNLGAGIVFEALNTLKSLFDNLKIAVDAVTPGIEKFVELGLAPIAEWVGGAIQDALRFISGEFQKFGAWAAEHQETFTQLGTSIGELTGKLWSFIEPLADQCWEEFKNTLSNINECLRTVASACLELYNKLFGLYNSIVSFEFLWCVGSAAK